VGQGEPFGEGVEALSELDLTEEGFELGADGRGGDGHAAPPSDPVSESFPPESSASDGRRWDASMAK